MSAPSSSSHRFTVPRHVIVAGFVAVLLTIGGLWNAVQVGALRAHHDDAVSWFGELQQLQAEVFTTQEVPRSAPARLGALLEEIQRAEWADASTVEAAAEAMRAAKIGMGTHGSPMATLTAFEDLEQAVLRERSALSRQLLLGANVRQRVVLLVVVLCWACVFLLLGEHRHRWRLKKVHDALRQEKTRREKSVAALRANQALSNAVFQHAPFGVEIFDPRGRSIRLNPARMAMLDDERPTATSSLLDPTVRENVGELFRRTRDLGTVEGREFVIRRFEKGEEREVVIEQLFFPLPEEAGEIPAVGAFTRDVTERRKMYDKLVRAEHMASLGTLASGIAHEINNPLHVISTNIRHLLDRAADEDPVPDRWTEVLSECGSEADRMKVIVADLLSVTRDVKKETGTVDVAEMLTKVVTLARNHLRHRARLVIDYEEAGAVEGVEVRLTQVFLNLLINAAQAIPEGYAQDNEIRLVARREGGHVRIEISDTGAGILASDLSRLFDPFFTTKEVGKGTGLGLWVAHGIVESMGGRIDARSEVGKGTTFTVTLCAAEPVADEEPAVRRDAVGRPEGYRILVVDDMPTVGLALERILGQANEVFTVTEAPKALQRFEEGEVYDVVLCDMMMPAMTGMEFYAEVANRWPEQSGRLVFITGGAFTPATKAFLERVENPILRKPFSIEDLTQVLKRQVGEHGRVSAGNVA